MTWTHRPVFNLLLIFHFLLDLHTSKLVVLHLSLSDSNSPEVSSNSVISILFQLFQSFPNI